MNDIEKIEEYSQRLKNCAITVDILRYLNGIAIDMDFNRSIEPEFLDETMKTERAMETDIVADSRFPVVVLMAVPHYHKRGELTDVHVRMVMEVIVKSKIGKELDQEYATIQVDVPLEVLEHLPNIPEIRWIDTKVNRQDWIKVWENVDKDKLNQDFVKEIETFLEIQDERREEE